MTALVLIAVCAAGGVGAGLRFVVDGAIRSRVRTTFPLGTAIINVSGSLLLGLLVSLTLQAVLPQGSELILGTGLMGGYTTFSAASIETMRLLQQQHLRAAALNSIGVLILTVTAGAGGLILAQIINRPVA